MPVLEISPLIIDQINSEQEPEETYWFVWDRGADRPWGAPYAGPYTDTIAAFAFESDAMAWASSCNGKKFENKKNIKCDGYPRQASLKEVQSVCRPGTSVDLLDRDLNFIRRLA